MADQKGKQGFASMDEKKQHDIASKGGQSVQDEKRGVSKDHDRASEAGRKGGEASHGGGQRQGNGNFADDPERAAEAGRKGGQSSHGGGR